MDHLESLLLNYLKARPNRFLSPKEIARDVVDKKSYRDDPWQAKRPLSELARRGYLQTNEMGHFRYVLRPGDPGFAAKKAA